MLNKRRKPLRLTHFNQMHSYAVWAESEGIYYGNKKKFDKRHAEIMEWLAVKFIESKKGGAE